MPTTTSNRRLKARRSDALLMMPPRRDRQRSAQSSPTTNGAHRVVDPFAHVVRLVDEGLDVLLLRCVEMLLALRCRILLPQLEHLGNECIPERHINICGSPRSRWLWDRGEEAGCADNHSSAEILYHHGVSTRSLGMRFCI